MRTPPFTPTLHVDSAVELVSNLLQHAYSCAASDIHIIPTGDGLEILLRRDGELEALGLVRNELASTVVGRFKVLADLLVYRNDVPQEGRIPASRIGIPTEVRVATYPTLMGEKVAVRLDAQRGDSLRLHGLGLPQTISDALIEAIQQPEGVILLTGPSGSGKTTTLYSCLNYLVMQERRRNIVTVEDPVERRIAGVVQTEVDDSIGVTYGAALRSILRQDPEVILLGEIRDHVTAATAMEAGLTGHLILSTVHAGSAPQVFARLMEMQIEPFAMTSVIRGVLSQRLLRRRCGDCLGVHHGCDTCGGSGYDGRALVSEWLPMSEPLRRAILARTDSEGLTSAAVEAGFRSLRDEAQSLVAHRVTTQAEVDRVLGRIRRTPAPQDLVADAPEPPVVATAPASSCIPRPDPGAVAHRLGPIVDARKAQQGVRRSPTSSLEAVNGQSGD